MERAVSALGLFGLDRSKLGWTCYWAYDAVRSVWDNKSHWIPSQPKPDKGKSSSREGEWGLHQCLLIIFDLLWVSTADSAFGFYYLWSFPNCAIAVSPLAHLAVTELWFMSPLQVVLDRICQRRVNSQGKNNVEKQIARNMCSWWKRHECRTSLGFPRSDSYSPSHLIS